MTGEMYNSTWYNPPFITHRKDGAKAVRNYTGEYKRSYLLGDVAPNYPVPAIVGQTAQVCLFCGAKDVQCERQPQSCLYGLQY